MVKIEKWGKTNRDWDFFYLLVYRDYISNSYPSVFALNELDWIITHENSKMSKMGVNYGHPFNL